MCSAGRDQHAFRPALKVAHVFELPPCSERCPVRLIEKSSHLCPAEKPLYTFYLRHHDKPIAAKCFSVPVSSDVNMLACIVTRSAQAVEFIGLHTKSTTAT